MRILLAAAIILPVAVADAKTPARVPKPHYEAVANAGAICSATGAFGRAFARSGRIDATAEEDWAPFTRLTIGRNEIRAEASFHGAGETLDDDIARAADFRRALDKALTGRHVFQQRQAHGNGVEFLSGKDPGAGLSFLIRQDEDRIVAGCVDPDR